MHRPPFSEDIRRKKQKKTATDCNYAFLVPNINLQVLVKLIDFTVTFRPFIAHINQEAQP